MTLARTSMKQWRKLVLLIVVMLATIGAWEVGKAILKITDANAATTFDHFVCYNIAPAIKPVHETVTLFDQFHSSGVEVRVLGSNTLCTPAAKL